jgi:iron(III) transport system substrate-binding protein
MRPHCAVRTIVGLLLVAPGPGHSSAQSRPTVVVYSSEDRQCDEPILKDFEKETGIHVEAVFDKEAAEVVMKRLIDEKNDPRADVYWANEPVHPDTLKAMGITQPYVSPNAADLLAMFKDPEGHWTAFSARARVLVVHSGSTAKADSILAYADPKWAGKAVLANPLLNTTAFNLTALFTIWGDDRAWKFLDEVKRNGVQMSPGNGDSALMVASGKAAFSLVDVDDALQAARTAPRGVELRYPDQGPKGLGTFMVANALAMIRGGHNPDNARRLIDYLLTAETQRKLAFSACAQTPLTPGVEVPPTVKRIEELRVMPVNYSAIRTRFEQLRPRLKAWAGQ